MADLLTTIKKAATDAVDSAVPVGILSGTVINTDPLKIRVSDKLVLSSSALLICDSVRRKEIYMKMEEQSEPSGDPSHTHNFIDFKKVTVANELKIDDVVLLIRQSGGQQYIIIDRVGAP